METSIFKYGELPEFKKFTPENISKQFPLVLEKITEDFTNIEKNFSDYLADRKFGKEGRRQNTDIFTTNFKNIQGKVIILVDDPTENYRDVPDFYELVNGSTKRYVRKYTDYQMKNEKSNETYISETKNFGRNFFQN